MTKLMNDVRCGSEVHVREVGEIIRVTGGEVGQLQKAVGIA